MKYIIEIDKKFEIKKIKKITEPSTCSNPECNNPALNEKNLKKCDMTSKNQNLHFLDILKKINFSEKNDQ